MEVNEVLYQYPYSVYKFWRVVNYLGIHFDLHVEINPKLRTIELTKLLENIQETLKKGIEYVKIHKLLMILIYTIHH